MNSRISDGSPFCINKDFTRTYLIIRVHKPKTFTLHKTTKENYYKEKLSRVGNNNKVTW